MKMKSIFRKLCSYSCPQNIPERLIDLAGMSCPRLLLYSLGFIILDIAVVNSLQ